MVNSRWHFRSLDPAIPGAPRLGGRDFERSTISSRVELFQEAKRNGQVRSTRARSKQEKDQNRLARRLEKTRILHEAHYDNVNSIGEVDALTSSTVLDINRAEVLRDPKRHYIHPSLRNW